MEHSTPDKPAKPSVVDESQVRKAVVALQKWVHRRKQQEKLQLVEQDDEQFFYVVVSLKKTPEKARTNGHRIPIPHSLYPLGAGREVCLFVKDGKKGAPVSEGQKEAKAKVAAESAETGVTKVIGLQKLRMHYKPFEAKRQLCGSYDLFLADDRILPVLPKLLGKVFFEKKKQPLPITLRGKKWAPQIRAACDATYCYLREGPCSVVRAARLSHGEDEVVENVLAVIAGVAEHVPRKWKNIQSVFLKTQESTSLPLFSALPEPAPLKIAAPSAAPKQPSRRSLEAGAKRKRGD